MGRSASVEDGSVWGVYPVRLSTVRCAPYGLGAAAWPRCGFPVRRIWMDRNAGSIPGANADHFVGASAARGLAGESGDVHG